MKKEGVPEGPLRPCSPDYQKWMDDVSRRDNAEIKSSTSVRSRFLAAM
jgi:hypothetical protein